MQTQSAKNKGVKDNPDVIFLGMIQQRINQQMESLIHMAGLMKGHNLPEFLDPKETKDLHQLNTQVLGKMILRPRPPSQNNDDDDSGISRS